MRFFYVPNANSVLELPEEEAQHAVRVLRMEMGDEMMLMDGEGTFYRAIVTEATKKRCFYHIEEITEEHGFAEIRSKRTEKNVFGLF